MPLFSEDDFKKIKKSELDMPDGLVDGNHYLEVFQDFAKYLEELDVTDYESKVKFMMNIVNPVFVGDTEEVNTVYVFDLITCMSFHIVQLIVSANGFNEEFKNKYIEILHDDIIPSVKSECEGIPYWN